MNKKIQNFILALLIISGCATHTKDQLKIAASTRSLGEAYLAQGNPIAALKEFTTAIKITPDDPYLHYDLGLTYLAREKYELAKVHLQKAIGLKDNYTAAMNSLGVVLMKQKKWDGAIALFSETADNLLYTTPHYPLSNMGWAFLGKGDLKAAESSFKKALKARPDFINAIHGLATTYLTGGQTNAAQQLLDRAILKYPDAPILHADLARTLEAQGFYKEASQSWRQVMRLAPEGELGEEATNQLRKFSLKEGTDSY